MKSEFLRILLRKILNGVEAKVCEVSIQKRQNCFAQSGELTQQRFQLVQNDHIGAITFCMVRIRMSFQKHRVTADSHSRPCQGRDHSSLSAGSCASRQLDAVCCVVDDGHTK